jgi:hypothetical protein
VKGGRTAFAKANGIKSEGAIGNSLGEHVKELGNFLGESPLLHSQLFHVYK